MASASDRIAVLRHLEESFAAFSTDSRHYRELEVAAEIDRIAKKAELARLLGVFDDQERDEWVQRAARISGSRPPEPELRRYRARALAHLETLRGRVVRERTGASDSERQAKLDAALVAYEWTGLLTEAQSRTWSRRLSSAARRSVWLTASERRANRDFRGRGSPRVFPGPGRRINGVRILTVSVYDDGVVLSWEWSPRAARRQRPEAILSYLDGRPSHPFDDAELRDDLGRGYQRKGGYGQGTGYPPAPVRFGQTMFAGTTSESARQLTLVIGTAKLSIPIRRPPATSIRGLKPVTYRGRQLVWARFDRTTQRQRSLSS